MNTLVGTIQDASRLVGAIGDASNSLSGGVTKVIETVTRDYELLSNKPSINGVELIGDLTSEDLGIDPGTVLPQGGSVGDILVRTGSDSVAWETPASSAEQDNTRPITAAAVYTEIGNINALLAII